MFYLLNHSIIIGQVDHDYLKVFRILVSDYLVIYVVLDPAVGVLFKMADRLKKNTKIIINK